MAQQEFVYDVGHVSLEDLTLIRLMEEIIKLDSEIKMKKRWMEQRGKMLHSLILGMEAGKRKAIAVWTFLREVKSLNKMIPSNTAISMKQGYVF